MDFRNKTEIIDFCTNKPLIYSNVQNDPFFKDIIKNISYKLSNDECIKKLILDRGKMQSVVVSTEGNRLMVYYIKFFNFSGININMISYPKNLSNEQKVIISNELSLYGFTQTMIANVLDISQPTVSNYLNKNK